MKKQTYVTPAVTVLQLRHCPLLVSASVIAPDEPNVPAGAPDFFDDEDDLDWSQFE